MKFVFYSVVGLAWLGIVILPGVYGWEYYMTPVPERPFTELHDQLKPTGFIGHGYGVIGSLFMVVGVATYTLRKRVAWFAKWGKLRGRRLWFGIRRLSFRGLWRSRFGVW